jgi:predicted patatin/cPLA2 family phospholipase
VELSNYIRSKMLFGREKIVEETPQKPQCFRFSNKKILVFGKKFFLTKLLS